HRSPEGMEVHQLSSRCWQFGATGRWRESRRFRYPVGMESFGDEELMTLAHPLISFTAHQIAEHLRGEVFGDGSVQLTGFAPADNAKAGDLTFAEKQTYFAAAEQSAATAILVSDDFTSSKQ